MKRYVIYEEVPRPGGGTDQYYHTETGDVSRDPRDAKIYKAKNWIEIIITVLQFVLKLFGNSKLKYKQI